MADSELARMGIMIKEAAEFRSLMEGKYKDLHIKAPWWRWWHRKHPDDAAQIKALLIDVLCLLHVEFYIRPRE